METPTCTACREFLQTHFAPFEAPSSGTISSYTHHSTVCALPQFLQIGEERKISTKGPTVLVEVADELVLDQWNGEDLPGMLLARARLTQDKRTSSELGNPSTFASETGEFVEKLAFCPAGSILAQAPAWTNSEYLTTQQLLPTISQWLRECYTYPDHAQCRNKPPRIKTQLPHRVIDVGLAKGTRSPRLITASGFEASYTVLSHCWGTHQPFVTTRATLGRNLEYISMSSLPKTFRDAIYITRGLGIRYLWIDSLCIVQDDAADWESESANMVGIYQNATLTLAATAAKDSREGCCIARRTPSLDIAISVLPDLGFHESEVIHVRRVPAEPTLRRSILQAPLNQRAWVLQELLLSSRVVHFAQDQMYWQCSSRLASEDGLLNERLVNENMDILSSNPLGGGNLWLQSHIFSLVGNLSSKINWWDGDISRNYWWTIVEEYSRRQLTRQSDRLPALAGLTEFFQIHTGDTPVAGLWQEDLLFGLLWHARKPVDSLPVPDIPSWSWASLVGPVERCPVKKTKLPSGKTIKNSRYVGYRAEVVRCEITWAGFTLVSRIARGKITLRGRVIGICILEEHSDVASGKIGKRAVSLWNQPDILTRWYFSHIEMPHTLYSHPSTSEPVCIGMGSFDRKPPPPGTPIICLELSFTSPFRDSSLGPSASENAFHEVLFLEPVARGNDQYDMAVALDLEQQYSRGGAGIIYADSGIFDNAPTQEVSLR